METGGRQKWKRADHNVETTNNKQQTTNNKQQTTKHNKINKTKLNELKNKKQQTTTVRKHKTRHNTINNTKKLNIILVLQEHDVLHDAVVRCNLAIDNKQTSKQTTSNTQQTTNN